MCSARCVSTFFSFQAEDRSAGQPHAPSELVTRRLPLGECEVPDGLNGRRCCVDFSWTSFSARRSGWTSAFIVGWTLTLQEFPVYSLNRTVLPVFDAHAFCQRAQPHPSRFNSLLTRRNDVSASSPSSPWVNNGGRHPEPNV